MVIEPDTRNDSVQEDSDKITSKPEEKVNKSEPEEEQKVNKIDPEEEEHEMNKSEREEEEHTILRKELHLQGFVTTVTTFLPRYAYYLFHRIAR